MLFSILLIVFAAFLAWLFIFQIYEVKVQISNNKLNANDTNGIILKVFPLNSLGKKAPFRSVDFKINVVEGEKLIKIVHDDNKRLFQFIPKGIKGSVKLEITSPLSYSPSIEIIEIL